MHQCLECVHKHIEQAMVVHEEEVPMGYPEHIRRVRGHLAEAARECVSRYPKLANLCRDWRRVLLEDPYTYVPPYDAVLDYVDALVAIDDEGTTSQELYQFITADDDKSPDPPETLFPPVELLQSAVVNNAN